MPYMSEMRVQYGIRCLLFDLGDTLWYRENQGNWENLEGESNQFTLDLLRQCLGSAYLPELDDRSLGQYLRQAFDKQIRIAIRNAPLLEPDPVQAIASVLQTWGITELSPAICASLFEALRVRLPHSRPLFADSLSTLATLRQRGFLLGIVTNRLWGGAPFYEDIQTIGLLDYFDRKYIAVSGDLGIRKPNPHIFEYALNALQVKPEETAMIGDSLSADILGAQALGIYAIWKPKSWLREWALAHAFSQTDRASMHQRLASPETFPGNDTANAQMVEPLEHASTLPAGMHRTDDDYILTRANTSRNYLEQFLQGEIRPDCIIGHLAELLEIFPEAQQV